MPVLMQTTGVLPLSISPINSSQIQIGLSAPYLGAKDPELFSVQMYNIYDSSISIDLTVTGIDAFSGNLQLKYLGGVSSGYYKFKITAADIGRIKANDL